MQQVPLMLVKLYSVLIDNITGAPVTSITKLILPSNVNSDKQYEFNNDLNKKTVTISKIIANPRSAPAKAIVSKYNSDGKLNKIALYDIPTDMEFNQSTSISYFDFIIDNNESIKVFIFDNLSNIKTIGIANTNIPSTSTYNLQMPSYFNDNMVLQRDESVNIWGKYKPFSIVTVSFADQTKATTSDANGDWSVILDYPCSLLRPFVKGIDRNRRKLSESDMGNEV